MTGSGELAADGDGEVGSDTTGELGRLSVGGTYGRIVGPSTAIGTGIGTGISLADPNEID